MSDTAVQVGFGIPYKDTFTTTVPLIASQLLCLVTGLWMRQGRQRLVG